MSPDGRKPGSSLRSVTRRHFFEQASFGIGGLALASLMDDVVLAETLPRQAPEDVRARALRFPPRVKRVIYLFMAGAPSKIDLFDPKPALTKHDGQDIPADMAAGVDRIVMLLCGTTNLREISLFPMNQQAVDLLMGAPSEVATKQLRDLHIRLNLPDKA
jgi:hypothetical protein